jgi:endonuclease/exonuclease/phosphatase family metal-dependent hydrolase
MKRLTIFFLIVLPIIISCQHKLLSPNKAAAEGGNHNQLKVMSYNIHHANPPSKPGLIDVQAIAEVIKKQNPDIVALQEIDVHTNRSGKELNEAELLAEKTGMSYVFAKAIDYDGGEYGIAILSKYPMEDFRKIELPSIAATKAEPRVLATALIKLPGGKMIRFACTHLDAQRNDTNRVLQIQKIVDVLKQEQLPIILAGDLNAVSGSKAIEHLDKYFTRTCIENCGFTIPEISPTKTIDFIAFTPERFDVVTHEVIEESYASDHRPVVAVLKY